MCSAYRLDHGRLDRDNALARAAAGMSDPVVRVGGSAPVCLEGGDAVLMRWGFRRSFNPAIHNARVEKLDSGMWRDAFAGRRCLIPLTAYYEWGGQGHRRAHELGLPGRPLLWAAGLWENEEAPCFAMITTAAQPSIAWLHDRMPVLLPSDAAAAFLRPPPRRPAPVDVSLEVLPCPSPLRKADPADNPAQGRLF